MKKNSYCKESLLELDFDTFKNNTGIDISHNISNGILQVGPGGDFSRGMSCSPAVCEQ